MKISTLIILISLVSCNASINIVKGNNNDINARQRIDSVQLMKNNIRPPLRW